MNEPRPEQSSAILPDDSHDRELEANVRPRRRPTRGGGSRYDIAVVGGGTAGLVTAAAAAGLGARVALVERELLGGDCLVHGCVPSKALLAASKLAVAQRDGSRLGLHERAPEPVEFASVMEGLRASRATVSHHDAVDRFEGMGIDVFSGSARFVSRSCLEVEGCGPLSFRRACIATGATPSAPPIPGLRETGYLTNESLFALTRRPERLLILGGGPIGCEMAQAFARLGSHVTLVESLSRLLPRDDADASKAVAASLARDGVSIRIGASVTGVTTGRGRMKVVAFAASGTPETVECDEILVATGRRPRLDRLDLDAAGIDYDSQRGIVVDDRLKTTNRRVFAAGDCCTLHRFTHVADAMARIVVRNALFFGRARMSRLVIPRVTYCDPEVAQVGMTTEEAESRGLAVDTYTESFADVDRAIVERDERGFARIHAARGSDRIVGATIVAPGAGEIIGEVVLAMRLSAGLSGLSSTIHPYPTRAEVLRKLGDAYNRSRVTPRVKRWLARWFAWQR